MKKLALILAFTSLVGVVGTGRARAEIGTIDAVPAATLLLPYFEVDLLNPNAGDTVFTINNASASAAVAHVTLWTDEGIPTFNFDVYLTGFDMQSISLRSLFDHGVVPITADDGADPNDTNSPNDGISNQGLVSQDINFPVNNGVPAPTGPCTFNPVVLYSDPALTELELRHIRRAHTGRRSEVAKGCVSAQYDDLVARGYVTVDSITSCTIAHPTDPAYFSGIVDNRNILWGDYTVQRPGQSASHAGPLVHIESCIPGGGYVGYVGSGATCPFTAGDYTFYGRLNGFSGTDQREPLPTTFAARYVNDAVFNGGTDLLVWRDTKEPVTGNNARHHCVNQETTWFPLPHREIAAFDEAEQVTELCTGASCFPLATQRVSTTTGNAVAAPLSTPYTAGWFYLNLKHDGGADLPGVAQAWVETAQSATGRFSVGFHATPLDNALTADPGGGVFPEP